MARKAARAVQTEEQRSNPLKCKAGKGKEAWSQDLSVTKQNKTIFSLELVVGHHPRLVAGSWLYQGKLFTANEKFCRNSCIVSGVHSEGPPKY